MQKKLNRRKSEMPVATKNIVGVIIAGVIGALITILLTLILSLILSKAEFLSQSIKAILILTVLSGAVLSGFIASKRCSFKGLISGLIATFPFLFVINAIMLIFSQGKLKSSVILLYVGAFICSSIGGIISANTKRR